MNLYVLTERNGHVAPGMVSFAWALSEADARWRIDDQLRELGLAKDPREGPYQLRQIDLSKPGAIVERW